MDFSHSISTNFKGNTLGKQDDQKTEQCSCFQSLFSCSVLKWCFQTAVFKLLFCQFNRSGQEWVSSNCIKEIGSYLLKSVNVKLTTDYSTQESVDPSKRLADTLPSHFGAKQISSTAQHAKYLSETSHLRLSQQERKAWGETTTRNEIHEAGVNIQH